MRSRACRCCDGSACKEGNSGQVRDDVSTDQRDSEVIEVTQEERKRECSLPTSVGESIEKFERFREFQGPCREESVTHITQALKISHVQADTQTMLRKARKTSFADTNYTQNKQEPKKMSRMISQSTRK